ncbi:hypothetical protein BKA67DRAFT_515420 [Truncatella angustata]|uniref:Uncharacterized protein n=1 Tax=Truncatella angustata TaxID=152316 RepID=A0A9P8ZYV7_9PEZI|nr:uncharacterized protein BKA67DRAFT_515420 [Truncatella angustata]KAH6655433.1 hypothetical protein BKA67DRAFT_515420 [Truncatella angustata]
MGRHTKHDESSVDPSPSKSQQQSNTNTLPGRHASNHIASTRHISSSVQRNGSHAKDQYGKAGSANTSKTDTRRNASVRSAAAPRPGVQRANTSFQTRYMDMLLSLDTIPRLHNIYASLFTWILLAGYVVLPGTFTSIRDLSDDTEVRANSAASTILDHVKNVPLLVIAAICCGIGMSGMIWLMIRWRNNYVWLLNRLLLPGTMNGLAGLIGTLVTVYTQQNGSWSISAKVGAIVEGCSLVICGMMFVFFNNLLLARIKRKHGREIEKAQAGEGFLEKAERKLHEPALEPGSVV